MSISKRDRFKNNRASLDIDGNWEGIADELSLERDFLKSELKELKKNQDSNSIVSVNPEKCKNWEYSDRSDFELGDIDSLSKDIKRNGQFQPAIIRRINSLDYDYEVIAGERRWRACMAAGVFLKAIVTDADDESCLVIQTSENKKESLSLYSLAKVYERMMGDKKLSQNKMAELLNIPRASFSQILSFNKVPDEVWDAVQDMSSVAARTARYIAVGCDNGSESVSAFISLSEYIRAGRGVDFLSKKLDKYFLNKTQNRSRTLVEKNKDGNVLFRITENGRVTLDKYVTSKYSLEEIAGRLSDALK